MDRTEISEIFCGAVDTIINARLKSLSYDITKQYVITKNDLSKQGIYTVSDGSVSFEAHSYDKTLKINDKVMVTIPNGDYSQHKIIVAKIEPEKPDAYNYSSQLDLMEKFTENIILTNAIETFDNNGLLANDQGAGSWVQLCTLRNDKGNLSGYTRLGISADFQSLLNNLDVVKGNYGLKLYISTVTAKHPGDIDKDNIYEVYLDATDMIGNPYKYNTFSRQEKVIDISMIENIAEIQIFFYQNGNFTNSTGSLINWEHVNNILEIPSSAYPNNLFVKNVELFLGYELGEHENDRMKIYCSNSSTYSYADIEKVKHLQLKWMHKFENGQYRFMDMSDINDMGITLKWFRRNLNAGIIDNIVGRGWEEISVSNLNKFNCDFVPDQDNQEERIKVVGYRVEVTTESLSKLASNPEYIAKYRDLQLRRDEYGEDQAAFEQAIYNLQREFLSTQEFVTTYTSEEFILINTVKVYDITTINATSALSIYYEDGSDGNYFIYDTSGKLPSSNKGRGYQRQLRAIYNGKAITPALGKIDWIEWHLPTGEKSKSMLVDTTDYYVKNGGQIIKDSDSYYKEDYICVRRYPNINGEIVDLQSYSIQNNWSNTYNSNTVKCIVSINGVRHTASTTMRFGKSGTQGTNTTLIIELLNNHNAITIPVPKDDLGEDIIYTAQARAFDSNGDQVSYTSGGWEWSWKIPMVQTINDEDILTLVPDKDEPYKVNIKVNIKNLKDIPSGGYYGILQVTFKQSNDINLMAYLTIPLKAPNYSHIEGASEITYNSAGSPSYDADAYKIFMQSSDEPFVEIYDAEWSIVHDLEFYKLDSSGNTIPNDFGEKTTSAMSADYVPKLHQIMRSDADGLQRFYYGLQAAPFYAEGYDKICVLCKKNNNNYTSVGYLTPNNFKEAQYYTHNAQTDTYTLAYTYIAGIEYFKADYDILWIQPLLITSNRYENTTINNWDGTLMTDEGNSTVMATIIGAGRKNSDNTFSGVLMGEVKDSGDTSPDNFITHSYVSESDFYDGLYYYKDEYGNFVQAVSYDKNETYYSLRQATGLYGFQNGEISFSLKDTGVATFGKANRGQIIIDGNESTITSKNFKSIGSGMHLDMDDGIFKINDNGRNKITLSPSEPYLLINGINEKSPLMKIGGEECFLQSQQRSLNGLGTRFNLVEGVLDICGTGGNVLLSGKESDPFFRVTTRQGTPLINMDLDNYYLQSAYFSADSQIRTTDDELGLEMYTEKPYVPIAVYPDSFEEEKYKYFIYNETYVEGSNEEEYIEASGDYDFNVQYYRKGDFSKILGCDPLTNNLYTLNYNADTDKYTAKTAIDIYEIDDSGNLMYPIMWYVEKYELNYAAVTVSEDEFWENKHLYYTLTESNTYIPAEDYGTTLYVQSYIAVNNTLPELPEDMTEEEEERLISSQLEAYRRRELTPIIINGVPSGMKLDLVNGKIEGYNLKLVGTRINQESGKIYNRLIINTEDAETPLQIGRNFRVHWDGEVECTKVTKISYNPAPLENLDSGVYKSSDTGYELDLKNGTFNGTANTADGFSDVAIESLLEKLTHESLDDNFRIVKWGQLKLYLNNNFVSNSALSDTLSSYVSSRDLSTTLNNYVTSNTLSNYATSAQVEELQRQIEELQRRL